MFTREELVDAVNELTEGKHSIQNCEKLAAVVTVLDHFYPPKLPEPVISDNRYSGTANIQKPDTSIPLYGETKFLKAIEGKDSKETWMLMDELMSTLSVINHRLYESVMRKL